MTYKITEATACRCRYTITFTE